MCFLAMDSLVQYISHAHHPATCQISINRKDFPTAMTGAVGVIPMVALHARVSCSQMESTGIPYHRVEDS